MTIACPDVPNSPSVAAWGAANRVSLYPAKWQTWVLGRAVDRDHPDDSELRKMARNVMHRWFGDPGELPIGGRSGAADLITVGPVSTSPPTLATTLQSSNTLPGPSPLLKPGKALYLPVRFVWRSESLLSRPWPTWRVTPYGFAGPCPRDADWMLLAVGTDQPAGQGMEQAPPEQEPVDRIGETLKGPGSSALTWVGVGLVFFGGVALLQAAVQLTALANVARRPS